MFIVNVLKTLTLGAAMGAGTNIGVKIVADICDPVKRVNIKKKVTNIKQKFYKKQRDRV